MKPGIGLVVFFASAWGMYLMRREYLPVQVLARSEGLRPCKALVLHVSAPNFSLDGKTVVGRDGNRCELVDDIDQDSKPGAVQWNWRQLLRALLAEIPEEWQGRRCLDMSDFHEWWEAQQPSDRKEGKVAGIDH